MGGTLFTNLDKDFIIANSISKPSRQLPKWLNNQITYGFTIRLTENLPFTIDSIAEMTLTRFWKGDPESRVGRQWTYGNRPTPLQDNFFNNPVFLVFPEDDVRHSLSVLCILALKCVFDSQAQNYLPGLLFLSEVYSLQLFGVWGGGRDCDFDKIVSKIANPEKRKSKKQRSWKLVERFLLDSNEINNMVCWYGGHYSGPEIDDLEEKVWVLNAEPENIRIFDNRGRRLLGNELIDTLGCLFPPITMLSDSKKKIIENLIRNGQKSYFRKSDLPMINDIWARQHLKQCKLIIDRWSAIQTQKEITPFEVNTFDDLIESYSIKTFVGRKKIMKDLDKRLKQKFSLSQYILILGEAGIGKTALMVRYLSTTPKQTIRYFFESHKPDRCRARDLVRHLYVALSSKYHLEYGSTDRELGVLMELLRRRIHEISERHLLKGNSENIYIDGIDESFLVQYEGLTALECLIGLKLPSNFQIIIFCREMGEHLAPLKAFENSNVIYLTAKEKDNLIDITHFLRTELLERHVSQRHINLLIKYSDGNFQYANLVVDMIKAADQDLDLLLSRPPRGLFEMYQWKMDRIREKYGPNLFQDILRIMRTISLYPWPKTPREICDILGLDYETTGLLFDSIIQFIDLGEYRHSGKYRWFHNSFLDYCITPERLSLAEIRKLGKLITFHLKAEILDTALDGFQGINIQELAWRYAYCRLDLKDYFDFLIGAYLPRLFSCSNFEPQPDNYFITWLFCEIANARAIMYARSILCLHIIKEAVLYLGHNKKTIETRLSKAEYAQWLRHYNKLYRKLHLKEDGKEIAVGTINAYLEGRIGIEGLNLLMQKVFIYIRHDFNEFSKIGQMSLYYTDIWFAQE